MNAGDPAVDVVYIGLLHPLHYPYAMKCLAAGKPVLCEKPFAPLNPDTLPCLLGSVRA